MFHYVRLMFCRAGTANELAFLGYGKVKERGVTQSALLCDSLVQYSSLTVVMTTQ